MVVFSPYIVHGPNPPGASSLFSFIKSNALSLGACTFTLVPIYRARTPILFFLLLVLFGVIEAASIWKDYGLSSRTAPHLVSGLYVRTGIVAMAMVLQIYLWGVRCRLQNQADNAAAASSTVG